MTPFERRTRDCQRRLSTLDADAAVFGAGSNCRYLSGLSDDPSERPLFLVVPAAGEPAFVGAAMDETRLADTWVPTVRIYDDADDPRDVVRAVAADHGLSGGHVLLGPRLWTVHAETWREALPDATWGLADEAVAPLRVRKDDHELAAMRRAAAIADRVVGDVRAMGADAVGLTERELAREIADRLADEGGEGLPFEVIVAAGPNGARPHHHHGDRHVERGDPVVLDFGTLVDGYPSDQTRTVVFAGDPPEGFAAAADAVRAAQEAAVTAVEPGATTGAVDAAARDVLADRGYADEFLHRTGHGVGLDVHEEPYVVPGGDRELEPGMVFSVEPGVYVEGAFGVRVEDLVVVTESGRERLNDAPRGWRV